MRVFVVGTGRCGSVTFSKACSHITNFTVEHEGRIDRKLTFPDNHIEVSPRLTWVLPVLVKKYPHDTLYVHLRRKPAEVITSWVRRGRHRGPGFWERLVNHSPSKDYRQVCELCYQTMIAMIEESLAGRRQTTMWLHEIRESWGGFWKMVGAEGHYQRSLAEWSVHHNASTTPPAKKTCNVHCELSLLSEAKNLLGPPDPPLRSG